MVVKILKHILLTFDIEELDFLNANIKDKYKPSFEGTKKILDILKKYNIQGTFFVTSVFAEKYPSLIKELSQNHEIALHGYKHLHNYKEMDEELVSKNLKKAKNNLEKIIGKKILGFRAPRLQYPSYEIIKDLGFIYDSSFNPTWIPGRYNNFFGKRKIFRENNLVIVPISVIPVFKLPLFWFAFRNLDLIYTKIGSLFNRKYLNLYLHSWEFTNLKDTKISFFIKRRTGERMSKKLENYIKWCLKRGYKFSAIIDYLENEKN